MQIRITNIRTTANNLRNINLSFYLNNKFSVSRKKFFSLSSRTINTFLFCLPISFHPIMCLAEHLAIVNICCAAFAPCRHMVGIHVFE